ncbi:unnamed protein product [Blepharisma stoltei]|uniref:Uncharacterized protein n=1 Tax=Blepharisma stoltei TaxID=1481888 RepID=A0AAU9J2C4_9CILI|nr:unnamed protein product [Blepharisma stoltei]
MLACKTRKTFVLIKASIRTIVNDDMFGGRAIWKGDIDMDKSYYFGKKERKELMEMMQKLEDAAKAEGLKVPFLDNNRYVTHKLLNILDRHSIHPEDTLVDALVAWKNKIYE